jgi:hypothetical protein
MKRIFALLFIPLTALAAVTYAAGQDKPFSAITSGPEKPLTQAEFVKLLYGIQKAPSTKADIVAAIRRRGIDFDVTDGLRGLTRSKSGNDEELRRALDEADRRRKNPDTAQPPSKAEAEELLKLARQKTMEAVGDMPDFVVKQQIQRSIAYAGTGNFRSQDRLVVAVSYRSTGEEDYKLLSQNGIIQNDPKPKGGYEEVGGTSSTGEFVTMLATIFKPESETVFQAVDTDLIRGRRAVIFDFEVTRDRARQVITAAGFLTETTVTGMKGRMWIDRENSRVLRVESDATGIPESFRIRSARRTIDYEWTKIADENYLLPSLSDVRLTVREQGRLFETRNLIRFKDYQKYGTDVIVVEEDNRPVEEQKPQQQP